MIPLEPRYPIFPVIQIFTVGYEAYTSATFAEMLARSGVEQVVDVRQLPISRKKGFAKNGLKLLWRQ